MNKCIDYFWLHKSIIISSYTACKGNNTDSSSSRDRTPTSTAPPCPPPNPRPNLPTGTVLGGRPYHSIGAAIGSHSPAGRCCPCRPGGTRGSPGGSTWWQMLIKRSLRDTLRLTNPVERITAVSLAVQTLVVCHNTWTGDIKRNIMWQIIHWI